MQTVSAGIQASFIIITIFTVIWFFIATGRPRYFLPLVALWMAVTGIVGRTDFFVSGYGLPPRFFLLILPPMLLIIGLFATRQGRAFIDAADVKKLTILHAIRIFVELVLYGIFVAGTIPAVMTFGGRNFDIVAGFTAPLVYYFVFVRGASQKLLLAWNVLSICLLFNIIGIAFLSLRTPLQRFGLDQPNVGLGYVPFCWLPAVVVPIVLLSHFLALRRLLSPADQLAAISK